MRVGEHLCQELANDWAAAQGKDDTASIVMTCQANRTPSSENTEGRLSPVGYVVKIERG